MRLERQDSPNMPNDILKSVRYATLFKTLGISEMPTQQGLKGKVCEMTQCAREMAHFLLIF
jgi:hypothetical protein